MAILSLVLSLVLTAGLLTTVDGNCTILEPGATQGCVWPTKSETNMCRDVKVYVKCIDDLIDDCDDNLKREFHKGFDEKKIIHKYCGAVGLASSLRLSLVLCGVAYFLKTLNT